MSELRDILTSRQLVKHHDLIQFLTLHPNTPYTLAQLDYLLPSGASVQRFPVEWMQLMREGHCGSRNIEVLLPGEEAAGDEEEEDGSPMEERTGSAAAAAEGITGETTRSTAVLDPRTVLLCRRPTIPSLRELATLLESPRTVSDPEGCVALQTSQIELSTALLLETQRRGLAYYFSAESQASAAAGLARVGKAGTAAASDSADPSDRAALLLSAASAVGGGVPSVVLALPPGVRVRYRLLTHRGITVADEYGIPVRLRVGELLHITFDDENAVRRAGPGVAGPSTPLQVEHRFISSKVKEQEAIRADPPLQVRVRSGPVRATHPTGPSTYTKVQLAVEARRAERFRLLLRVRAPNAAEPGDAPAAEVVDCAVDMEVVDADDEADGVLIGREREPSGFTLPPAYTLADPAVHHGGTTDPATEAAVSARAARVLPWWQSGSPCASLVRDAVAPTAHTVQAAAALVFTTRARTDEARLRAARRRARQQREKEEGEGAGQGARGRGRRQRRRGRPEDTLRNRHLIHFGLDASVPLVLTRR